MLEPDLAINILVFVGFLFSIVVHECAHGVVAHWCGDDTALRLGRITLNPLPHIDPFMSVLLPGMLLLAGAPAFGGAKPVPVVPYNLHNPRRDMMWVAWAGPMSNILLAVLFALFGNLVALGRSLDRELAGSLAVVLIGIIHLNLVLAAFNLIPVPPLDGSRILAGLLRPGSEIANILMRLEPYGLLIVGLLVFSGATGGFLWPVRYVAGWLWHTFVFF